MDIIKISQLANSSDPEMKNLAMILLISGLKSKKMYNKYRSVIKRMEIGSKAKQLIKSTASEKSLKIWIENGQETTEED